jgi:hypothetical protein
MERFADQACCPEFNPEPWDDKEFEWNNKVFIKGSIITFFYLPLNFGSAMKNLDKVISAAGANWSEGICLSEHTSKWNMDIYVSADKPVPSLGHKLFTGKFYGKVYEGPFKDTGKWYSSFVETLKSKGYKYEKIYEWYTTCPKCAKKYGKNYVVLIALLE